MFRFVSSKNPVELEKAYLAKYNIGLLQNKLEILMLKYPDIKSVLPDDITAKKLLIGNFKYLVKVYLAFTHYINGKNQKEKTAICAEFVEGGFNYKNHSEKIAAFLMDKNNGFDIYNCVYCDLVNVGIFIKSNGNPVRRFETEHVLDKGICPLVALSLYNFVPSCKTCNSAALKGGNTIGDTEDEIVKLSPTVDGYDFDGNVKFDVKIVTPGAENLDAVSHADDFEIDFIIKENVYKKSIDLFELKQRYNNKLEKIELLNWRDKRYKYPNSVIQQMAKLLDIPFDEMFENMFELNLRRDLHSPMEKARREVMML